MDYHIFHSVQVEASRALVASLGGDPSSTGTQVLIVNGDNITVTGSDVVNLSICPNIPGYPYITWASGATIATTWEQVTGCSTLLFGQTLDVLKQQAMDTLKSKTENIRYSLCSKSKYDDLNRPGGPAPGYTAEEQARVFTQADSLNSIQYQIASEIQTAPDSATLSQVIAEFQAMYGDE